MKIKDKINVGDKMYLIYEDSFDKHRVTIKYHYKSRYLIERHKDCLPRYMWIEDHNAIKP